MRSRNETKGILFLSLSMFVLLFTYYVLKTVRESLILTQGGAEVRSYSAFAQVLILLCVVPAYSALASRVKRVTLMSWISWFFATNLLSFYVMDLVGLKIGMVFFVWLGVFGVVLVSQFWAFANDLYSEEQGKQIFPILGLAGAIGALAGAEIVCRAFVVFSVGQIMLAASALLIIFAWLTQTVDRYAVAASSIQAAIAEEPIGGIGSFNLVMRSRYLLLIASLIVLANFVNANGEFILSKMAIQNANQIAANSMFSVEAKRQLIGAFYGRYFARVTLVGLILQTVFVSRILRGLGVSKSLFISSGISALGYASLAAVPALGIAVVTKIAENSIDYTLERTALHALFLCVGRAAKYKAKTAIDTFFCRSGDLLQALLVVAGSHLAFTMRQYALINVAGALLSIAVLFAIDWEYRVLARGPECGDLNQSRISPTNVRPTGHTTQIGLTTNEEAARGVQ